MTAGVFLLVHVLVGAGLARLAAHNGFCKSRADYVTVVAGWLALLLFLLVGCSVMGLGLLCVDGISRLRRRQQDAQAVDRLIASTRA